MDYGAICQVGVQLERLLTLVPRRSVHIVVMDDMRTDPHREYSAVLKFLGLEPMRQTPLPALNPARERISPALNWTIHRIRRLKRRAGVTSGDRLRIGVSRMNTRIRRTALTDPLGEELRTYFRDDVVRLGDLLQRDLTHWCRHSGPELSG